MERTFEELAEGANELDLQIQHGDIVARGAEGDQWRCEWHSDDDEAPEVERDGGVLHIRQRHHPPPRRLNLRLAIPARVETVRLWTGAGKIDAEALRGVVRLETGHGDLFLRDAGGTTELKTGAGRIEVAQGGGRLQAHSGHGDIILRDMSGEATLETGAGKVEVRAPQALVLHAHSGHGDILVPDGSIQSLQAATSAGRVECSAELTSGHHVLSSGMGDILLRDASGDVALMTAAGRIEVGGTEGHLRAHSGHGDIMLRSASGEVELDTSAGRIEIGAVDGRLQAHTGSGDIRLRAASGQVDVHSGSGRIEVTAPRDVAIHAHSANGDIRIGTGTARQLDLQSNSGRVECLAQPAPGHHELASRNGDVLLQLFAGSRARVDLQTGAGQVHSDFPLVRVGRPGAMSFNAKRMVGSIGEGEPELDIALRTSRGQIFLRRGGHHGEDAAPTGDQHDSDAETAASPEQPDRMLAVLKALAQGDISVEEADALLAQNGS